jgi:subtilase family serine protease
MFHIDPTNTVPERNISNNIGDKALSITGRPDLTITAAVASPSSQVAGGVVSLLVTLSNAGKSRIPVPYYARFYYSKDATISTSDTYLTYVLIGSQAAGETLQRTVTLRLPSSLPTGAVYVGVILDSDKRVAEANESNNTRAVKLQTVVARPELRISSFVASSTIQGAADTITVLFNVTNSGRDLAQRFVVSFYYGDSASRSGLIFLGKSKEIQNLRAGTSTGYVGLALTFPKQLKSGTRYLHYFVDSQEQVQESNETNNRAYRAFRVLGQPDLQVTSLSVNPLAQGRGGQFTLSYTLENTGKASAGGFTVRFFYSTLPILTASAVDLGKAVTVSGIDALSASPATGAAKVTLTVPTSLQLGPGYVGVWIDVNNTVNESVENNNTRVTAFRVVSPLPDVTVDSFRVTPGAALVGTKVKFQAQIRNIGLKDATTLRYSLYYSTDASVTTSDTLLGSYVLPLLARGQSVSLSQTVTLPASLAAGSGVIGLLLDPLQALSEVDEANNQQVQTFGVMVDKDGDGYAFAPGCPAFVSSCDCNDGNKAIHPKATELCDGKDNDCDGKIDPSPPCGCVSGKTRPCSTSVSGCSLQPDGSYQCTAPCKAGTQTCKSGQWGACVGEIKAAVEICDGKDNNCDGKIDEALSRRCYNGPPSTQGIGACSQGAQTCKSGQWGRCEGEVNPVKEVCDGKDNDCDGSIDNQSGSASPLQQFCASRCGRGQEYCFQGAWKNCDAPQSCEVSEPVQDAGPDSAPDKAEDCYTQGCPKGQRCSQGRCLPDPCVGVSCPSGEFCREGRCVKACGCLTCPVGEVCREGECKASLCAGVQCSPGELCNPTTGLCKADKCRNVTCGPGRLCRDGQCSDDPCGSIRCPAGQSCRDGQCLSTPDQCQKEPDAEPLPENEPFVDIEPVEPVDASDGDRDSRRDRDSQDGRTEDSAVVDKTAMDSSREVKAEVPQVPNGCQCSARSPLSGTGGIFLLLLLSGGLVRRRKQGSSR